jgi:hypothetical protein
MEPKVVQKIIKQNSIKTTNFDVPQLTFDPEFCYYKDEGSGNNWAYGYNVHGTENYEKIKSILDKMMIKIWETTLTKSNNTNLNKINN